MAPQLESIPSVDDLLENAKSLFREKFNREPTVGGMAPGRVNIIGR